MYKIRSVSFKSHPVLGDLELDLTGSNGRAVDTVIIAGENGCGKSTVMSSLYSLFATRNSPLGFDARVVFNGDAGQGDLALDFVNRSVGGGPTKHLWVRDESGFEAIANSDQARAKYPFSSIYSDVDINFQAGSISNVTSLELDSKPDSRKSGESLPKEVKQLIVDIDDMDSSLVSRAVENNPNMTYEQLVRNGVVEKRMRRFTSAFSRMFDGLSYDRVENRNGHKEIYFKKGGVDIPIDALSSGEKQIVYCGCFLLRDANAMAGAFVFIDEPEISLHPRWQKKIMDYYKGIFTDSGGAQTSQIFVVTHSPFVIHNESRRDDKVIVLERGTDGAIRVAEPTFYACDSERAVESAFHISGFSPEASRVYVEGRTDEEYLNKALEVFDLRESAAFSFSWVGHIDERGQEANTGSSSLNKAAEFLKGGHSTVRNACLFDCDTNHARKVTGSVLEMSVPHFENAAGLTEGIENSLVLSREEVDRFFRDKPVKGDCGRMGSKPELDKMGLCEFVCAKPDEELETVFSNLRPVIGELETFFRGE